MRSHAYPIATPIAVGASQSAAFGLEGRALKRIMVPSGTEGAAVALYQSSTLGGTYLLSYDTDGTLIELPFTAGRCIELNPMLFAGVLYAKLLVTDGAGTPVNQAGADAAIEVVAVDV